MKELIVKRNKTEMGVEHNRLDRRIKRNIRKEIRYFNTRLAEKALLKRRALRIAK